MYSVKEDPRLVKIQEILVDHLGIGVTKPNTSAKLVEDLGADSLDAVELVMALEEEYDCEISDERAEKVRTVGEILVLLNEVLGPAIPKSKVDWNENFLSLTEDQFDERYKPEHNDDGSLYRQRDWTNAKDWEAVKKADQELRAWTCVDDDDGDPLIISGIAYVNRMYYIITSRPREHADLVVQAQEEGLKRGAILDIEWEDDGKERPKRIAVSLLDLEKTVGILEINEETSSKVADTVVDWIKEWDEWPVGQIVSFTHTLIDDYSKTPEGVELLREA